MRKMNYVLLALILLMIFFLIWAVRIFQKNEYKISRNLYNNQVKEVIESTSNIANYLKMKYGNDLIFKLKSDKNLRKDINLYLHSLMNSKIKNLFIVYKPDKEKFFRVIADGSLDKEDQFAFNEKFEPLQNKIWNEVFVEKKPKIFKQKISEIWSTLLYPVAYEKRVEYVIVVDFSTYILNLINKNMEKLKNNLKVIFFVMISSIIILIIFLLYDWKRQIKMQQLIEELSVLNNTLEERIRAEIQKTREKDKQLILQSRLALMGELLSMIAHQWRQPLNVVAIIISNLKLDFEFDNFDKKNILNSINKIEELIQHMSNTIDDFRKFYRKETEMKEIDIKDVVSQTLNIIKASLENKKIKLITHIQCDKKIKAYPNELKQVLLNLIRNAEDILVERKVKDPYIIIDVFEHENKCIIEVVDNGGGINSNVMDKIFNPYFTTKDEKNGTGLGLYISKQIIEERFDGSLKAYNDNEGARFRIELNIEKENNVS